MTVNPLRRALNLLTAFALVLTQLMLLAPSTALGAPVVRVNSTGDANDATPGDHICATGGVNSEGEPECTLRASIQEANASGPVDEIVFAIPESDPGAGGGTFVISPGTGLPYLSQQVSLDATTQPGFAGSPIVVVDGSASAPNSDGPDGLLIDGDQITVRGLVVRDWTDDGIEIHGDNNTIMGNYVFTSDDGILIELGSGNVIGGPGTGDGNVVSGNRKHGVSVDGGVGNVVSGNYIGINQTGGSAQANAGHGVDVWDGAEGTVVGPGNVISGNAGAGIRLANTGTTAIRGNLIGLDATGTAAIGNTGHGILVEDTDEGSVIGGTGTGEGNVIAFNTRHGVALANHPGTAAAIVGNTIFSNGGLGIDLPKVIDGIDPNDAGDVDAGPNDLLNHPVITGAEEAGGDVYVAFELDVPEGWYRVEFFVAGGATLASAGVFERTGAVSSFTHVFPGAAGSDVMATATLCTISGCGETRFTSEFSATVPVVVGNHRPQIDPVPPQSVDEETNLAFTVTATDADPGNTLAWSLAGEPIGAAIDSVTGEFTWVPDETQGPGTYTFEIIVTDDGTPASLSDTTTVTVVVGEVNKTPDLAPIGDHSVAEGTTLVVLATAIDPDLPVNTLTYDLVGAPTGVAIDPVTGELSWTPDETQGPGSYTFQVTVGDDGIPGLTDTETTTITVEEVNEAPVVTNPGDQSHPEGDNVVLPITATDPDLPANTITYTASGLPPGLEIDPVTGVISGQIEYHANATSPYGVMVTATDDGSPELSHSTTFTWDTANTNRPPQLTPVVDQTVGEQTTLTFVANAADPDTGTILTFDLTGEPSGAVIDPITGVFTWTPTESQGPGTFTFDITTTDNDSVVSLSDTTSLTVTVTEVNRPPVLTNPGHHTVAEGSTLLVTAVASDPDLPANTLTYGLAGAPAGVTIDPVSGVISWTPTETQGPNTVTFSVTVSDNAGPRMTNRKSITVTVLEVNETPHLTNPGDQAHAEGANISLAVTATDSDLPANTLTYTAVGLPPGLAISPVTGQITGQIHYHAAASTPYTPTITVTDNGAPSRSHSATFTWHTTNTNRPPQLDTIPRQSVDENTMLTLNVSATDPDTGTNLTYAVQGAPSGAAINPVTGAFTWTPTEIQGPNSYTFDITATDDDVMTLHDTITLTIDVVEVNVPPVANGDEGVTNEDTSITIAVLANDTDEDLPSNRLGITSVGRPSEGSARVTRTGMIVYSPPANYHGPVAFDYTVSDGAATATATVLITVNSVNDSPVARDDEYRLVKYQPATLDVLANDSDADGERLRVSLVSLPDFGTAWVEGDQIVYEPRNGWTGAVEIGYAVRDSQGASALAVAKVIVGDEVLVGARALATNLGVDIVNFEAPAPSFDAETLSLINLDGITLLADSFFQTVDALRIPLGFLGVTVVMVVGLGATADVPALVFGTRRRHWAVVRLGRQQRLPAYSEPGGRKVVYNYDPTAAGIISTGKPVTVGNTQWLPVDTPNGKAYIYRKYLTEQLDLQAFLDDPRPSRLVHELADRLRKGRNIDSIVSTEGLVIALTGSPSQIAPEQLAALMGDSRLRYLATIGRTPTTPEEFTVAVAQPFLEAYDATPVVSPDVAHSRSALIPTECWNFPYLAVGTTRGVQPWLVFFEYRDGKPLIAGLGIDE